MYAFYPHSAAGIPNKIATRKYKLCAAKAARELGYGRDVVQAIREAKTESDVTRILGDARRNTFIDED